ncbi:MAG: bifunctional adenosylcobinamide kinase/adenosylcobinamide-phosphate guanylyltransferase [Ilumatobacteraceae bacterium]
MVTLLLGGARSGKSSLAVEIGRRHDGPVTFLATAEPFDDDLRDRIGRHRDERPDWPTIEVPIELASAVRSVNDDLLIVDCLTVWVGNLFVHLPDVAARAVMYTDAVAAMAARPAPTVVVSNEVGLGLVPDTAMGREYRDELGRLNQHVAAVADRTLFLAAGRAARMDDPWDLLR